MCGRTLYSTASGGRASLQLCGPSVLAKSLWASGLCAGAHSAAPTSLILADVVANIAAAAAAAAVTAAERGRETKGHGSKAEAPHLYRR